MNNEKLPRACGLVYAGQTHAIWSCWCGCRSCTGFIHAKTYQKVLAIYLETLSLGGSVLHNLFCLIGELVIDYQKKRAKVQQKNDIWKYIALIRVTISENFVTILGKSSIFLAIRRGFCQLS